MNRVPTKTKVINIVSGPGSGKTIMAAQLLIQLKLLGHTVEYVQEYAKDLVWTKRFRKLNDQYAVSEKQYSRLHSINGHVDYIVTDGSLLHGLYYNRFNFNNLSNVDKTEHAIIEFYNEFDNIVIFLDRGDFVYEQDGRIESAAEAATIDFILDKILKEKKIPFVHFESNLSQDNLQKIVDYIIKRE